MQINSSFEVAGNTYELPVEYEQEDDTYWISATEVRRINKLIVEQIINSHSVINHEQYKFLKDVVMFSNEDFYKHTGLTSKDLDTQQKGDLSEQTSKTIKEFVISYQQFTPYEIGEDIP